MIINRIENLDLVKFANSARLIASSNAAEGISVKLYKLHNEPGSAGFATGEVTHNLFIAVSEYDEYPLQNLFSVSEFLNPEFVEWKKISEDTIIATIEHSINSKRQKANIRISINNIKLEKQNL